MTATLGAIALFAVPMAAADGIGCGPHQTVGFCTFGICWGADTGLPHLLPGVRVIEPTGSTVVLICP